MFFYSFSTVPVAKNAGFTCPPPLVLFGPHAIVKIRTTVIPALPELVANLGILYQGRYGIDEEVPSREWAIVGSFGGGEIPI
jgi:hypothetical protein